MLLKNKCIMFISLKKSKLFYESFGRLFKILIELIVNSRNKPLSYNNNIVNNQYDILFNNEILQDNG